MNIGKSSFSVQPPVGARINIVEAQDGGYRMVDERVGTDGRKSRQEHFFRLDGKDYPSPGDQRYDSVAHTTVDAYTEKYVLKKAGKEVGSGFVVISRDGKTKTQIALRDGSRILVYVYDRQ